MQRPGSPEGGGNSFEGIDPDSIADVELAAVDVLADHESDVAVIDELGKHLKGVERTIAPIFETIEGDKIEGFDDLVARAYFYAEVNSLPQEEREALSEALRLIADTPNPHETVQDMMGDDRITADPIAESELHRVTLNIPTKE